MASTIIGKSIIIDGEVTTDEAMVVQGTVKGRIYSREAVQIDPMAVVEGDVDAVNLTVSGHLNGNVAATDRLEITSEGRLVGDVRAGRILFSEGASFKGSVDMDL